MTKTISQKLRALRTEERQMEIDNRNGKRIFVGRTRKARQPVQRYLNEHGLQNQLSRGGGAVIAPTSGGVVTRPIIPRFSMRGPHTVVTSCELLTTVTLGAAGVFSTNNLPLIAGTPSWLANVTDLYSKYRWLYLHLIYIPKCPTTTSGSVTMSLTYDRNDAAPTSRQQLTQNYMSINFPPYAGFDGANFLNQESGKASALYISLDVTKLDKPWYPSISFAPFNALGVLDQNQFCPASLVFGSDGGPTVSTPAGDIFIKYSIEFIEPINPSMNV